MKLLLDANTLFSGLGFSGPENRLVWLAILGRIDLAVSDYILAELTENITKKFTGENKTTALELLDRLLASEAVDVKRKDNYSHLLDEARKTINKKDAPILAAAMLPDIDALITGDKAFHTKDAKQKATISTTQAFLSTFTDNPP